VLIKKLTKIVVGAGESDTARDNTEEWVPMMPQTMVIREADHSGRDMHMLTPRTALV